MIRVCSPLSAVVRRGRPRAGYALLVLSTILLGGCAGAGQAARTDPPSSDLARARAAYLRQDFEGAARLLLPLAQRGDTEAQYALGYLHYYGLGIAPDAERARWWFAKAWRGGHRKAGEALESLDPAIAPLVANAPGQAGADDAGCRPTGAPAKRSVTGGGSTPMTTAVVPVPAAGTGMEMGSAGADDMSASVITKTSNAGRGLSPRTAPQPRSIRSEAQRYTVQLMGSRNREDLVTAVRDFGLDKAFYVEGEHQGIPWYRLFYGKYPTRREASAAMKALPGGLLKSKPWVRELSGLTSELKRFDSKPSH